MGVTVCLCPPPHTHARAQDTQAQLDVKSLASQLPQLYAGLTVHWNYTLDPRAPQTLKTLCHPWNPRMPLTLSSGRTFELNSSQRDKAHGN